MGHKLEANDSVEIGGDDALLVNAKYCTGDWTELNECHPTMRISKGKVVARLSEREGETG